MCVKGPDLLSGLSLFSDSGQTNAFVSNFRPSRRFPEGMMNQVQPTSSERHPPAQRRRWLWGGLALGVAMAGLLVWAAKRETKLDRAINQKLAELRAAGEPVDAASLARVFPAPPPELDAMPLTNTVFPFVRAHAAPGASPIIGGGSLARTEAMDEQRLSVLQRHYEESAGITNVLPLLPAGARFGTDWSKGVLDAPVASFIGIRQTIQMLMTRALYAAEVGDTEGATVMFERGFRFSGAVQAHSTLVEHMIRVACMKLACSTTERSLNRVQFTDAQLARVIESMPPPATKQLLGTIRVEGCMSVWVYSEVRAGRRLEDFVPSWPKAPWWKRTLLRFMPGWNEYDDEDFLTYLELIPQVNAAAKLPPREAATECKRLLATYATNVTSEVAQMIAPNWTRAVDVATEADVLVEATRAAFYVERFRLAHGRVPESLDALVPALVPSAPVDPLSGQPLRVKSRAPGYVVYSVGLDGQDDGGLEKSATGTATNYDLTVIVER